MRKLLFLFFILLSTFSFSQEEKDINSLKVPNVKIYYLNETDELYSKEQMVNFLNDSTNYGLLKNKGFGMNYVFIKIKQRGNFDKVLKRETSDSLFINNKIPLSCDFIIGFDKATKKFYRLKGFDKNDFDLLFKDCNIELKESLINFFMIEELDLTCLFNYHFLKNENRYNECIRSCKERDDIFIKLRHN